MIAYFCGRASLLALCLAIGQAVSTGPAFAAGVPLAEEEARVEQAIPDVPVFLGVDASLSSFGKIHVVDANTLRYLGQISSGVNAQMAVGPDHGAIYVASTYYARGFRGERTDVIEKYDRRTLTLEKELAVPTKRALVAPMRHAMRISHSGRWLYIQNFTPAASVTVVDLSNWSVASEIPNPGCFGIYPYAGDVEGFSTLCGDGTMIVHDLGPDGRSSATRRSVELFDVDEDPWFVAAEADGERLIFVSFKGTAHIVDLSSGTPEEITSFDMIGDIEGGWRPGGYQLLAYHKPSDVLFVLMHPDGKEGSHKNTAPEIWAYNVASQELISRSEADKLDAIAVFGDQDPVVLGVEPGGVYINRYESDRGDGYKLDRENYEDVGSWMPHIEILP